MTHSDKTTLTEHYGMENKLIDKIVKEKTTTLIDEIVDRKYPQGITAMKFIGGDWVEVDVTKEIKDFLKQERGK
jgi:hypothetical protein